MKQVRRFLVRGTLVPFALFALVIASSIPASAAPLDGTPAPSYSFVIGPLSLNW
jgi:hypothetical protein